MPECIQGVHEMNLINTVSALLILVASVSIAVALRRARPRATLTTAIGSLLSVNGLTVLACAAAVALSLLAPAPALAQTAEATGASTTAMGAALATGLACIGAGIAVGIAGAAAIGGITEKPEILGRTLIFVGLAEGIAIYGLIISFMILNA